MTAAFGMALPFQGSEIGDERSEPSLLNQIATTCDGTFTIPP